MPDTWIEKQDSAIDMAPSKVEKALAWIKANRETFIGSVVIAVAVIIFGVYFFMRYSSLRDTAWKSLFIAQQTGMSGRLEEASKQLNDIETGFSNTSAWGYTVLTKGDILFAQGKFKEASAEFTKVFEKGPKELVPFALYDLGKSAEAAGDIAGAKTRYTDFLSKYPEHFMAPEIHWSLARMYFIGKETEQAKLACEKISLLYPDTYWAALAKAKLAPAADKKK